jgi:hypothetical protein
VSITINTGSTTSNGGVLEVAELVTITSFPPGPAVEMPPFFNLTPSAHQPSGGVIVQPLTTQLSAHLPAVLQHSGGPLKVASKLDKVF